MTTYSPASSLGWLDLDAAAADRVATLLRALQEPSTLDVLGLGSVRDAFSQMLHPGTSYVHTRLRYLMFLPWIFQRLEADKVAPGHFFRRLRHHEAELIDCLRHLGPGQGVIGYQAGRNLKRMPSFIYWGGLWDWGLRRLPLSMGEYARRAAAVGGMLAAKTVDDDGHMTDTIAPMWAPLPDPPGDFLRADIDFEMRPEEVTTLVDNLRRRHPETLLASLCADPRKAADCRFPWDLPDNTVLSGRVPEVLRHARCFSELTSGPQIAYNFLVARQARQNLGWDTVGLEESQLGRLQQWVEMVERRHGELKSWADDLPAFWEILHRFHIRHSTRNFITRTVRSAVDNPQGFENDPTVHEQIRLREIQLKGKRARLAHRAALENWNRSPSGGQFEYRWSVAKRYLAEIATASQADL